MVGLDCGTEAADVDLDIYKGPIGAVIIRQQIMGTRSLLRRATSVLGWILLGCQDAHPEMEGVSQIWEAISICDETVPSNRIVEGIPAYSQCSASRSAAIYSNNGVDTATSAVDSDWKRTQFAGGYQCTELANRYLMFRWNIKWLPSGDAWSWCSTDPPSSSGLVKTSSPVHGDLIVFGKGVCGSDTTYGHVALVDTVDTARERVTFVEQNQAGRRTDAASCATCFLHVVANDGSASAAGASGSAGSAPMGSGGTTIGAGAVTSGGRGNPRSGSSSGKGGVSTTPAETIGSGGSLAAYGGTQSLSNSRTAMGGAGANVGDGRGGNSGSSRPGAIGTANGGASSAPFGPNGTHPTGGMTVGGTGDDGKPSSLSETPSGQGGNATATRSESVPGNAEAVTSLSGGRRGNSAAPGVGGQQNQSDTSPVGSDSGCSCAVAGRGTSRLGAVWVAAAAVVLMRRRKGARHGRDQSRREA